MDLINHPHQIHIRLLHRHRPTVITTQARWLMHDWLFNRVADEYALSSDWDNRWRTGGDLPKSSRRHTSHRIGY